MYGRGAARHAAAAGPPDRGMKPAAEMSYIASPLFRRKIDRRHEQGKIDVRHARCCAMMMQRRLRTRDGYRMPAAFQQPRCFIET